MATDSDFLFSRELPAPRSLVFAAWTDPVRLQHWWGPKGFSYAHCTLDLRPGGLFHYCLSAPDGRALWGKFLYREVITPERLVYVASFSDERAATVRHPMSPSWPLDVLSVLVFTEQDGKTRLDLAAAPLKPTDAELSAFTAGRDGMRAGFAATLNQLEAYLQTAAG